MVLGGTDKQWTKEEHGGDAGFQELVLEEHISSYIDIMEALGRMKNKFKGRDIGQDFVHAHAVGFYFFPMESEKGLECLLRRKGKHGPTGPQGIAWSSFARLVRFVDSFIEAHRKMGEAGPSDMADGPLGHVWF